MTPFVKRVSAAPLLPLIKKNYYYLRSHKKMPPSKRA